MTNMRVTIRDSAYETMIAVSLAYTLDHWTKFAEEMGRYSGPDGEKGVKKMRDEMCHFLALQLYENQSAIAVLMAAWGEGKTTDFVNRIVKHKH